MASTFAMPSVLDQDFDAIFFGVLLVLLNPHHHVDRVDVGLNPDLRDQHDVEARAL